MLVVCVFISEIANHFAYANMWDTYSQNNHQDNKVPPNPVRHSVGT